MLDIAHAIYALSHDACEFLEGIFIIFIVHYVLLVVRKFNCIAATQRLLEKMHSL